MGTLYAQDQRKSFRISDEELDSYLTRIAALAKKHILSVPDVLAAAHVLELQRGNNLKVSNGDIFDEQIAGLGTELQRLVESVSGLAEK